MYYYKDNKDNLYALFYEREDLIKLNYEEYLELLQESFNKERS